MKERITANDQIRWISFDLTHGDGSTGTQLFKQDIIKIGKLASSHLQISDDGVSRMHAVVEIEPDAVYIIDLGSVTGTFVNGKKINKCEIRAGDVLTLGAARAVVNMGATPDLLSPTRKPYTAPAIEKSELVSEIEREQEETFPPAPFGGFGTRLRPGYSAPLGTETDGPSGCVFQMREDKKPSAENWYAFECLRCGQKSTESGGTGIVFDVRSNAHAHKARCPVCGFMCELRAFWPADADGYGSRSTDPQSGYVALLEAAVVASDAIREWTIRIPTGGLQQGSALSALNTYDQARASLRIAKTEPTPAYDIKEIDHCVRCPMLFRDRDHGHSLCTHWGSPEFNRVPEDQVGCPEWCPIREKPLLLKVIR